MSLKDSTGNTLANLTFKTRYGHEWVDKTTDDYFKGKTVAVFSLPGAYTPTCSSTHLPRYNELYDTFKRNGVDDVICVSVNDSFVMNSWQEDEKAGNITMLPDGNGEFSEALGMLVDKSAIGFGKRSWRYSMLVKDGKIEKMFIENEEPGDPFKVSDADTLLKYINPNIDIPKSITVLTRPGCPFCAKAKNLLNSKKMKYEELVLNRDFSIKTLIALSGGTSVPQIFMNGEKIGGSDNLEKIIG